MKQVQNLSHQHCNLDQLSPCLVHTQGHLHQRTWILDRALGAHHFISHTVLPPTLVFDHYRLALHERGTNCERNTLTQAKVAQATSAQTGVHECVCMQAGTPRSFVVVTV